MMVLWIFLGILFFQKKEASVLRGALYMWKDAERFLIKDKYIGPLIKNAALIVVRATS